METLTKWLTPSKLFLLFWLALLAGLAFGQLFSLPLGTTFWLLGIWLILLISGQETVINGVIVLLLGLTLGFLAWQLTGGETWLHSGLLAAISAKLLVFRDLIVDKIFITLPEPHGSLMAGILLGNRVKLDPDLIKEFQRVGLSHIIAVSGYNLTILSANIRSLLQPWLGQRAIWIVAAVLLAFVLITGAPASVIRASVMAAIAIVAELLGRPNRSVNALVVTAGLIALFEPKIILDIGFQLSVAATYGLVRISPVLKPLLIRVKLPVVLGSILSETLAATLMTAPIIIVYFGRFSPVSLVTNLLILPLIPFLMGLGLVGVLGLVIWPLLGQFLIKISWPLLELIIRLTHYFSGLSFASVDIRFSGLVATLLIVLIMSAAEFWHSRQSLEIATN